jgi:hypothetical protein
MGYSIWIPDTYQHTLLYFSSNICSPFSISKRVIRQDDNPEHDSDAPTIQTKHAIPSLVSNLKALILQIGYVHSTFKRRTRAYRYPPFGRCLSIHFCQVSYKLSIFPSNLLLLLLFLFPVLFCFVFFGCV